MHRRTGRCGVLAIATWAAWFWAAQGLLLTKKKEERKGRKGRFNIFAMAGLRTQFAPDHMLVQFEQIRIVRTTRNFSFLTKKTGFLKSFFDKAFTPFWKTFL